MNTPPTKGLLDPRAMMDFFHGRRRYGIDMRMSSVHFQQHSPPYYRQSSDEYIKPSESPSCKRRRLSRSDHHIDLNVQPPSPPRRSPRQHPPSTSHLPMQVPVTIPMNHEAVWSYTTTCPQNTTTLSFT
ncbi:unnamed protein product [Diabrotica balteata]|uniref:Uncharacterized protein n=1 Tax=Diabrotica balteata TaxID=107213 RepID=A0A9N9SQ43_DIABA|nr:unnamed protein product [Diabrotica balteata]